MVRNRMERFNEFLVEKTEEPLKPSELEIVVLGLSDEEGTFADLIQKVAKKRGIKHTLVISLKLILLHQILRLAKLN